MWGIQISNCPEGYYCTGSNINGNENPCPAGKSSNSSAKSSSDCFNCAPGTYSTSGGLCLTCPEGYYCTGGTGKTQCDAGKYSSAGSSSCSTCGAGYYSSAGSSGCLTCGVGTYSSAGSSSCSTCGAGYYSSAGSSVCSSCPAAGGYSASSPNKQCSSTYSGLCDQCKIDVIAYCRTTLIPSSNPAVQRTYPGILSTCTSDRGTTYP